MNFRLVQTKGGRLRPLMILLGVGLLGLLFFSPVDRVMDTQLDSSNYGSYAYFTAREFQYGTEVVPMAGPYGFVPYGDTYSGYLFGKRVVLEALTKLVLAALTMWFFTRLPDRLLWRCFWLLLVALMIPPITDLPYILAIALSGLFLAEHHLAETKHALAKCCALAGYLALLTLFKGTQTMLAAATLGLLLVQSLMTRNFRRLPWILFSYVAALLVLLLIAGQNPLNAFDYMHGVSELAGGYNQAMALDEPLSLFLTGAGTLVSLECLIVLNVLPRWRDPVALAGGLFLAGFAFVSWKHGFVRSDGHVLIYFNTAAVLVPTILLFMERTGTESPVRVLRWLSTVFAVIALALSIWCDGRNPWERPQDFLERLPGRLTRTWNQLSAPTRAKQEFQSLLNLRRNYYQIPRMRELVGSARIDFFGNEQAYLMLNRLNYRPRPMGGGTFNVFTPWLRSLNVASLLDKNRRPEFFLVNVETIDDRVAAQDDAGTLLALLTNYTPVESGSGLTLFRASQSPSTLPTPRPLSSSPIIWNQPILLPSVSPNEMVLVSLDLPLSRQGRVRSFFYKAPLVFMDLDGIAIEQPADRKVIPGMFQDPVPLSPLIETTPDLLGLYEAKPGKTVRQFALKTTGPGSFDPAGLRVHFYAYPKPAPAPTVPMLLVHSVVSKVTPDLFEAAVSPMLRDNGLVAQIMVPPGRIGYKLKGDETTIVFTFGMSPLTYSRSTDGMEFIVDLVRPGYPTQVLFQRRINPHRHPKDQGPHEARLSLPPFPPGTMLYLRTDRGPDNDGAWDLGYYTAIDFIRGPFTAAQFPGFTVLPVAVNAGMCGRFNYRDRDVFSINSPGSLTFTLTGTERVLEFTAGILENAYTRGGHTDGVEYQVNVSDADGTHRRLFQYYQNPRQNPTDQVELRFSVDLPSSPPGTHLTLTISPGPAGDISWDWAYLSKVYIH